MDNEDLQNDIMDKVWGPNASASHNLESSFRRALAQNAIEVCANPGTEEEYIDFCAETVQQFLDNEKRNALRLK